MPLAYRNAQLSRGKTQDPALVRALQQDLRTLGYLKQGIDGEFGEGTTLAVRRLQFDLQQNNGDSTGHDGPAPVALTTFNRGVTAVTGTVDPALADSIEAALADPRVPRLPQSTDPAAANRAALASVADIRSTVAPTPFLLAIFQQESSGQHYVVPTSRQDTDTFVTVGLDANGPTPDQVTSRGYGLGQYTIFHHPPRPDEISDFITDPVRNVQKAFAELRDKFDHFVAGPSDTADDRVAEHPALSLRLCRYAPSDARYMRACKDCALEANKLDIDANTPLYHGSAQTYGQAKNYSHPNYAGVPDRAAFLCDWPYAVRRYNGSGPDSFNYQAKILFGLLFGPTIVTGASS
jgi:peptidoglycan hydrolase-like protein with peptidoglycan-binding domain